MPMVECPNCAAKLDAPAKAEGHTIRCPQCGEVFVLRFPVRSDPVIEIYGPTDPAAVTPDSPRTPRSRRRVSDAYRAQSNERRDVPWLILDFGAVLRGMHTIVSCRVKNPEAATLEVKLVGPHGPGAIEATFGPNHPIPSKKEFATGRFPVGTPVSATLFDAAHNARHRAEALVVSEPSDMSANSKHQ
jgi:hypothetical protein